MNVHLTRRTCLCCGKRSVWCLIALNGDQIYRVYYCGTCDLKAAEPQDWTDPN